MRLDVTHEDRRVGKTMMRCVFRTARKQIQIFKPVVFFVFVYMMHHFFGVKKSLEMFFNYKPMFKTRLAIIGEGVMWSIQQDVAGGYSFKSFPLFVAFSKIVRWFANKVVRITSVGTVEPISFLYIARQGFKWFATLFTLSFHSFSAALISTLDRTVFAFSDLGSIRINFKLFTAFLTYSQHVSQPSVLTTGLVYHG